MEWTLEIVLSVLLLATLLQALRLERALGVLKRERAALEALVGGFNMSMAQAESGIQRLHAAADGAGRQLDIQVTRSVALKDDLSFLSDRGEILADRLERLIKSTRPLAPEPRPDPSASRAAEAPANQIERELLHTLRAAR
jgi:hypothetical protein